MREIYLAGIILNIKNLLLIHDITKNLAIKKDDVYKNFGETNQLLFLKNKFAIKHEKISSLAAE